jgi:uncharacterized protein (DUF433 family)
VLRNKIGPSGVSNLRCKSPLTSACIILIFRYDFLNAELFGEALANVLVTLQRHAKPYGYFSLERFIGRTAGEAARELAMEPGSLRVDGGVGPRDAPHEMVRFWQQVHARPPRRSYRDKQWAAKMKKVGLYPSSTGEVAGKETGAEGSHYIVACGAFDKAFAKLAPTGFNLRWQSPAAEGDPVRKKKAASKTKMHLPDLRTERVREARRATDLRELLRPGTDEMSVVPRPVSLPPEDRAHANLFSEPHDWWPPIYNKVTSMPNLDRITRNPDVMDGNPCLRGMRVTVGTIVGLAGASHSNAEILAAYPYIQEEDIRQALSYAA